MRRSAAGARLALAGICLAGLAGVVDGWSGPPLTMVALYGLAALQLAAVFVMAPVAQVPLPSPAGARLLPRPRMLVLSLGLLGVALPLLWLPRVGGAVGALVWLVGLILLPFAFVEAFPPAPGRPLVEASPPASSRPAASPARPPTTRSGRLRAAHLAELAAVVLLLAVGAAFRFYALADYPTGVHGDETELGLISATVPRGAGPYPFGVVFLGDPALFVYVNALGIAAMGQTIEAIRAVAAVSGWLGLLPTYWLARQLFGVTSAVLALAFLATNHTHVHFSRLALNVPQVMLLTPFALACLWAGVARGRPVWYVLAGIVGGLDLYFHFGARPLPLIFGAVFGALLVLRPAYRRAFWVPMGLTMLGALAALGPTILFFARNRGALNDHTVDRLIFSNWEAIARVYGTSEVVPVLWGQALKNLSIFVQPLPQSALSFYQAGGDPAFVAPVMPFLLLGLVVAVLRTFDPRFMLLVLWFVGFLAAGIVSFDAPQPHRLAALLPVAAICAGVVAGQVHALSGMAFGRWGRAPAAVGLVGLVAFTGVEDAQAFFVRSAGVYPWSDATIQARYLAEQAPGTTVLLAASPHIDTRHGNTRYLAGAQNPRDVKNLPIELEALDGETSAVTFAVNKGLVEWLAVIRTYYPGGHTEQMVDGRGTLQLIGYRLEASATPRRAAVDIARGLHLTVTPLRDAGEPTLVRTDPVVAYREAATLADRQPFTATWSGELVARRPGEYRVALAASGDVRLTIGGKVVLERGGLGGQAIDATVRLEGRQAIELRYVYRDGPGFVELYWHPSGGERELIPPDALRPPPR